MIGDVGLQKSTNRNTMISPISIELNKQKKLKRDLSRKIPKLNYLVGYLVISICAYVIPPLIGMKVTFNPAMAGLIFVIISLIISVMSLQNKLDAIITIIGEDEINSKLVSRMKNAASIDIKE